MLGEPLLGLDMVPTFRDPYQMTSSASITDCTMAFILGHEYGHFELGHLHAVSERQLIPDRALTPVTLCSRTQVEELAADLRGVELADSFCRVTHRPGSQMGYFAPPFMFHLCHIIERIDAALDRSPLQSHPTAAVRRNAVDVRFRPFYDAQMVEDLAGLDRFFAEVVAIGPGRKAHGNVGT
jgi:hypothetical protein